jgi:hypothetical protein
MAKYINDVIQNRLKIDSQKCDFKHFGVKFCGIPKIIEHIKDIIFLKLNELEK